MQIETILLVLLSVQLASCRFWDLSASLIMEPILHNKSLYECAYDPQQHRSGLSRTIHTGMFFSSKYCSTTPSVTGRIHRCTTMDTENPGWEGPTIHYTKILHCAEGWRPRPPCCSKVDCTSYQFCSSEDQARTHYMGTVSFPLSMGRLIIHWKD